MHLNRCKGYDGRTSFVIPLTGERDANDVDESRDMRGEDMAEEQRAEAEELTQGETESEADMIEQEESNLPTIRYPQRNRNPKRFYLDPVPWSEVPRSVLYPKPPL